MWAQRYPSTSINASSILTITVGTRFSLVQSRAVAAIRGLYRRLGLSPYPEDMLLLTLPKSTKIPP